jgi:hydrogenase-4 component F
MRSELLLWAAVAVPAASALLAAALRRPAAVLGVAVGGSLMGAVLDAVIAWRALSGGPFAAGGGWLRVDALSAFHLALLALVSGASGLYAHAYFAEERRRGAVSPREARLFGGLWCGTLAALALLLVSNNLGLMWVGLETTTLLTAFLISLHVSRESLEAMWKYLLICSVAIAFAFMGTLLAAAAAAGTRRGVLGGLVWTGLLAAAPRLDPALMRAAFIFLIVGYGTKAGLAPMHNWLPDAHSQAPAPVSSLFSGFMLNGALYCVLRFLPVMNAVPGCQAWAPGMLLGFGVLSVAVGAGFILFQRDAKRLLAYCSVEHMGLIAAAAGLGGLGTFAALLHSLNHSVAKTLAFFTAGRLGQAHGHHDIARMAGAVRSFPVLGVGLLVACLALVGAAPFATFVSELLVLKAAFDGGRPWIFVGLLAALGVAFVGLLRHAIRLALATGEAPARTIRVGSIDVALVACGLGLLVLLCVWIPEPLHQALVAAAQIVDGQPLRSALWTLQP